MTGEGVGVGVGVDDDDVVAMMIATTKSPSQNHTTILFCCVTGTLFFMASRTLLQDAIRALVGFTSDDEDDDVGELRVRGSYRLTEEMLERCSKKMMAFLANPIQKDLKTIPNLGPVTEETLEMHEIRSVWQLMGKCLSMYDGDPGTADKFVDWLKSVKIRNPHVIACAVVHKLDQSFPGIAPDDCLKAVAPSNDVE